MAESDIETYLRKKVEASGGKCWKWVSPGRRGVPDRIVLMPGNVVAFVETKSPGKTERPDQKRVQKILRDLGCLVFSSVNSKDKVDSVVFAVRYLSLSRRVAPGIMSSQPKIPDANVVQMVFEQMQKRGDAK